MAADTREASTGPGNAQDPPSLATPLLATTERRYHGKIYETFTPPPSSSSPASQERTISPPENANAIPGGTTNTAGGRVKEVTFWDGIKSINMNDVKSLHQIPCVRDAMLVGIGSGFLLGGGRMVFGATMWRSMSWAVGTFCISSAGMFEFCQQRRKLERRGMEQAAEIMGRKKIEKERQAEKLRVERRRKREEEERSKEEAEKRKKDGWSFWGKR